MASFGFLFFLSLIIMHLSLLTTAQATYNITNCSSTAGTYTADSPFQSNLKLTLSSLLAKATTRDDQFYSTSTGKSPDIVYGLFQCRIDVSPELCRSCIKNSSKTIMSLCPSQKEAIIWYDECMLRYANRDIYGKMEDSPDDLCSCNPDDIVAGEGDSFNGSLVGLMNGLVEKAGAGSSSDMFAADGANYFPGRRLYGLVQCTPDILPAECKTCLSGFVKQLPRGCCGGRRGGRNLKPSCSVRYEWDHFYNESAIFERSLPPATSTNSNAIWISVGTSVSAFLVGVLLDPCISRIRGRKQAGVAEKDSGSQIHLRDFGAAS